MRLSLSSAFRLTDKLGVTKLWQRLLVTALCGIFPSVLIYSHYLLSEPLSTVFVWLLLLVIFRSEKENGKKAGAFFAAVTAGLLYSLRLFPVAVVRRCVPCRMPLLSLCKARRSQKKQIYFSTYAITFILLFAADIILTWLTKDLYAYSGGILQSVAGSLQALTPKTVRLCLLL